MIDDALPSHVVVRAELIWMRSQTEGVVFFLFHVDPVGDEVGVKDIAFEQEGMIGLERSIAPLSESGRWRFAPVLPAAARKIFIERITGFTCGRV